MNMDGCTIGDFGTYCPNDSTFYPNDDSSGFVCTVFDTVSYHSGTVTLTVTIDGYDAPYQDSVFWEEYTYSKYPLYYSDAIAFKKGSAEPGVRNDFGVLDTAHSMKTAGAGGQLVILIALAIAVLWILVFRGASRRFTRVRGQEGDVSNTDMDDRRAWELARLVERHPEDPASLDAAMELGRRHFETGDFERAIKWYERAIKMAPSVKNPEAHFKMAHALRYTNYLCDAIDEWMACYMEDPDGELGRSAWLEAQRWRAYQIVKDTEECPACGATCRLTDLECSRCRAKFKRTLVSCGVCGKTMVKEAQVCIHCLPDDVKLEVALGMDWPIVKTTMLDWEAQLIRSRLDASGILSVLTGEKGSAIPLTVGYLGEIHVRVPATQVTEARQALGV